MSRGLGDVYKRQALLLPRVSLLQSLKLVLAVHLVAIQNNSSEGNNIAAVTSRDQRDIVENMIGDINKIVPFVSVDAIVGSTISLQLARESNIQSAPNTEGLGIQSL